MSEQVPLAQLVKMAAERLRGEYAALEPPSFRPLEPETLMLPMADGIYLRTVIRKPDGPGPFPTIVQRGCYPFLEGTQQAHAEGYTERGFAFVYQFCRGVGGSEGVWVPNVHERSDGKSTLDWLDAQPWVESIGHFGSSYLALTGWVVADILPPKVKTLYLTHYGTDRFASAYQRGLFRQDVLTGWAMGNAGQPVAAGYLESARYRPQIEVDVALWKTGELPWYRDWITNTNRQDPYWNGGFWKLLKEIPSRVRVPVYLGGSWYDHHLGSALQTWQDLSEESRAHSTLRIGAWNHMFMPCVDGQPAENLRNSDTASAFEWFRTLLREGRTPSGQVEVYRIGQDAWVRKPSYPFPAERTETFYLSAQKSGEQAYALARGEAEPGEITYVYDPDDPVLTHGAESVLESLSEAGSRLQPGCGYRPDVISFVSAPLDRGLDILGRIGVTLYVSSDAEDTAFTARLMEVFPDGQAYNIRGSVTTLAYRGDAGQNRQSYEPGSVVEATIDMWDVMWRVRAGSRLRLDISSSNFPEYAAHTNHAGVWALQREAKPARQSLWMGQEHPARLVLPVENAQY